MNFNDFLATQGSIPAELQTLLNNILSASLKISSALRKSALANILGSADSSNVQGEDQKKLDVLSDQWLIDAVQQGQAVAALASEEQESFVPVNPSASYLLTFDPLDGSSNIDVNISVGTIFSILPFTPDHEVSEADFLQPGNQQVAAGYILYGPSTQLVLGLGDGKVHGFTLDPDQQEYIYTGPLKAVPADTQEFAINMSNQRFWQPAVQQYIAECLAGTAGERDKNFNMRWVGSMVGDVHRLLTRGGIFMYPYDVKDPSKAGRLRLMYEANPMSFLVSEAGGRAITGTQDILDVQPEHLHQRVPVMLGAKNEIDRLDQYHQALRI